MSFRSNVKAIATAALGITLCGATGYFLYLLFKKDTDDEYNETVPTSNLQAKLEIKIPKDSVRVVIGRNGSHIREIERKSQTKINFKDHQKDEDFRVCVVRGTNKNCGHAESLIHEFLAYQPVIENTDLWVPKVAIGRIIGRCGERIHYITQLSGAKIHVSDSDERETGERRISIKGTSEQLELAKSYILDIVREDTEVRLKLESKLAQREPRGKLRKDNRKEIDVMKQSSEKLTSNITGGDGQMEVYVSAIHDPSKFWLQIVGPKANELDQLVEEMTEHYSKLENQECHVISEAASGEIVAAVFMNDGKWYRAEVTDLLVEDDKQFAQLYFLDYGDTDVVPIDEIFELRTDFLRLRFQAIECFLARVKPSETEWSEEAIDRFEELAQVAQWKKLRARVCAYKERDPAQASGRAKREGSPIPGVDLYDVNNQDDLDIGMELVRNGFAVLEMDENSACENRKSFGTPSSTSSVTDDLEKTCVTNGNSDSLSDDTLNNASAASPAKTTNGSAQLLN